MSNEVPQVILHIGLHKTATTYLQTDYFNRLENVEVVQPERYFDTIGKFPEKGVPTKYLVSSEGLSGLPWNLNCLKGNAEGYDWMDSFYVAVDKAKLLFPHARIIVVFRKHGELVMSLFSQYIHEGGVLPLDKFYGPNGVVKDAHLSFEQRVKYLNKKFDQVDVLSFEDIKRFGDTYLDAYFTSIGMASAKVATTNKSANTGLKGWKLELLRQINQFYIHLPEKVRSVAHRLRISPRRILQEHLHFINGKDSVKVQERKKNLNKHFQADWDILEQNHFFKM